MRRVVVAAIAFVALASPRAFAQPHSPAWKVAVSAALAFGHAEGKAAALAASRISAAPTTKKAADATLDELDRRASEARDAFLRVQKLGSPYWAAAATVRIGDMFFCQAMIIGAIPAPAKLGARSSSLPPSDLAQYREVLLGLAKPLFDEANRSWEQAVADDASAYWAARARERLDGGAVPGC